MAARALLLELGAGRFVALAAPLAGLADVDPAHAIDLDARLGAPDGEGAPRGLRLGGERAVTMATRARLSFVSLGEEQLWALPRVLRGACRPWVRGAALLEDGAGPRLAIWIDLARLVDDLESPSPGQETS